MKKKYIMVICIFAVFFGFLTIFCLSTQNAANEIRDGVLRFHIVANSDSEGDQSDKFAVRDGIAELCSQIFSKSKKKEESILLAKENKQVIENKAKQILLQRGSDNNVNVTVRKRYFPTRHYNEISLPAGVYDTIDVEIGSAEGKNFWCVMFPDICVGACSKNNKQKMADVLDGQALSIVTEDTPSVRFKFKFIEMFEGIKHIFLKK